MKLCSWLQLNLNTDNAEGNGQSWKEDESVYVQERQNNKTQVPILLHKKSDFSTLLFIFHTDACHNWHKESRG